VHKSYYSLLFSHFFVLNSFSLDIKQLFISLAVSLLSLSSRSQIDSKRLKRLSRAKTNAYVLPGRSFFLIKIDFRDEKSALHLSESDTEREV